MTTNNSESLRAACANDFDELHKELGPKLYFDARGCGPTEYKPRVRVMCVCGKPSVGFVWDGGFFLDPADAREIAAALVEAAGIVEYRTATLKAFCNGYETIAATSEDEAREILRGMEMYDPEDLDGDGWTTLDLAAPMRDEDGKETGETVGDIVRAAGKPGHLWSVEQ